MDWLEKEVNPPLSTWQYMLCAVVVLFLIAGLVSWCVGAPDEAETSTSSTPNSVSVFIASSTKSGEAKSLNLPQDFHPWGAFEPGAWTSSRTIVESRRLGRVSSKTFMETNVILREKQNNIFSTVTESSVLLAGKSIQKEPQTRKTDFFGLPPEENRQITELPEETLTIAGVPVECRVLKITSKASHYRRETRIWINVATAPYVFRKERSIYRLPSNACCEHKVQNVTSTDLQLSLAGQVFTGFQYTQVSSYPTYISRSEVVASMAVPGRIVTQVTRETDLRGRPLQVISTELLDFGSTDAEHQNRVFRGSTHQLSSVTLEEPNNQVSTEPNLSQNSCEAVMALVPEPKSATEARAEEARGLDSYGSDENTNQETSWNEPWRVRRDTRFTRFFTNGKRFMSVEFSLGETPADSSREPVTQVNPCEKQNPQYNQEATTEVPVSPALREEETSVNPEDFKTPFELTGLHATYETREGVTLMGTTQMEPFFFPEFQFRWQMGKDLLLPGILSDFTRFFPHLPGEKWMNFLRERSEMKPLHTKNRSPLYDENLRLQEPADLRNPTEIQSKEEPDSVFPEDSSVQTSEENIQS